MKTFTFALIFLPLTSLAAAPSTPVLGNLEFLEKAGAKVTAKDTALNVGYAQVTEKMRERISHLAHEAGRCGGYEVLPPGLTASGSQLIADLKKMAQKDAVWKSMSAIAPLQLEKNPAIEMALGQLKEENIRSTVEWLSAYPSRDNRLANPNVHVNDLESRLREMLAAYPGAWSVQQITHTSTRQKSLRVHLEGKSRPSEIIVLGGHLDSINHRDGGNAPGADDNASGSASLLEALRVLITQGRPERSVEFFWYAGEESGLLGSAEIARMYKQENRDVVAVLQLDMTLFPGAGEFVIGNMQDFTSAWLRDYLVAMNDTYLQVRLIADRCGYGCSDHASWHRQGYPALMPFEAGMNSSNRRIHTRDDVVSSDRSSFRHSLVFAKIALVLAMDLGSSTARQP